MSCLRATPWRWVPSHDPGSTVITEYGSRVAAVCQDLSASIRPRRRGADPVLTHVACTTTSTTAFQHGAFASGISCESSAHVYCLKMRMMVVRYLVRSVQRLCLRAAGLRNSVSNRLTALSHT
jgi:hypothetical protein